jgi:plastocyanin
MMFSRRQFLYVLGGGVLAACGAMNRKPDYTVVIRSDATFDPSGLIVSVGSMVAWHNRADQVHTVTADPAKAQMPERVILPLGGAPFDSGDLFSGERWVYTFDVPGTYIYFCRYFELEEMIGEITVIA